MRVVLFDLDDTIFDFQKAEKLAFYETMNQAGLKADEVHQSLYSKINGQMWKMLEQNLITKEELKVRRFKDFLEASHQQYDPVHLKELFQASLGSQGCLIAGAEELLRDLSSRYDLYAATNGITQIQQGRIKKSGIDVYFKKFYISESMNCKKPEKIFFEKISADLKVPCDEFVLVGDSLTADIAGGRNAGVKKIWFNPHHIENDTDIQPDHEADSYERVKEILKTMEAII